MGRPTVDIDMEKLASLMRFRPTKADCAAFFKCSEDTIERRIKEYADLTFDEFRDESMVHTRMKLIQDAISRAGKSDTMLIFCLKNLCNWRDKQPDEETQPTIINNNQVAVTPEKLVELIRTARGPK